MFIMYYLSILKFRYVINDITDYAEITQLVKASSEDNARNAVRKKAIADGVENSNIIQIRISETIVGN